MSVQTLVADPEFAKLSPQEQKGVLAAVDPDFAKIGDNEVGAVIQGIRGQTPTSQQTPLQQFGSDLKNSSGILGTANTLLKAPEKMSSQGLQMLAGFVPKPEPTGNIPLDLIKGAPRIAADTVAKVAPGFISKGAILTAGALKGVQAGAPLLKMIGSGAAAQLESASGALPGSLEAAAKDASLIFARGKKAASPLYEAAKAEIPEAANLFSDTPDNGAILDKAIAFVNKGGKMEPAEALTARKAADALSKSKSYSKDVVLRWRGIFDDIAKGSDNIANADPTYARGLKAESLRNILPQNKYGGASPFKTMLLKLTGGAAAPVLSPAIQGVGATAGGAAVRNVVAPLARNPVMATAIPLTIDKAKEFLRKARGDKDKARQMATTAGFQIPE